MSTLFKKENFTWDGMYLMYDGEYTGSKTFGEVYGADKCHPTRIDMLRPAFVARFKYGYKPWKAWVNFLVKNATVEQYLNLADHNNKYMSKYGYETCGSPVHAMETLGYKGKK
jgi:hypothetical protein|tara:strand:+ start:46 stop:384 length:339 start_codon:yes stop_codon:yes gene_type:complete